MSDATNDKITIYSDVDYQEKFDGASIGLYIGDYGSSIFLVDFVDTVDLDYGSIKIPNGMVIYLYSENNFGGTPRILRQSISNLELLGLNIAEVLSIKVRYENKIIVYEHYNYDGNSQELEIGDYNTSNLTIGDKLISSVMIPPGMIVTFYEGGNFQGDFQVLWQDTPNFDFDFSNGVSSIKVTRIPSEVMIEQYLTETYEPSQVTTEDGLIKSAPGGMAQTTLIQLGEVEYFYFPSENDRISKDPSFTLNIEENFLIREVPPGMEVMINPEPGGDTTLNTEEIGKTIFDIPASIKVIRLPIHDNLIELNARIQELEAKLAQETSDEIEESTEEEQIDNWDTIKTIFLGTSSGTQTTGEVEEDLTEGTSDEIEESTEEAQIDNWNAVENIFLSANNEIQTADEVDNWDLVKEKFGLKSST
ncbi:MAG: hypothetical protein AAFW70_19855 [Cyanobacteria bacterium J06635_10]